MEKQAEFEISKEKTDQVPQSPISKMVDLFLNVREYLSWLDLWNDYLSLWELSDFSLR